MNTIIKKLSLIAITIALGTMVCAQKQKPELPPADLANVIYGPNERNVLDIWFADTTQTTPLVIYIHGGGFRNGSKKNLKPQTLSRFLDAGISVAAINYRYITMAPLPAAHHDAQRALQFIRHHASKWKIDKDRMGAFGGSAGAQICMWLAFSDEMANPSATDPIAKESTRLISIATNGGQTTMDFDLWVEWIPGYDEPHVDYLAASSASTKEEYKKQAATISAMSLISEDDPPIFMNYAMPPTAAVPTNPKRAQGWKIHHVVFGIKLKEKMDDLGVEAHLKYPGETPQYESNVDFFKAKLFE